MKPLLSITFFCPFDIVIWSICCDYIQAKALIFATWWIIKKCISLIAELISGISIFCSYNFLKGYNKNLAISITGSSDWTGSMCCTRGRSPFLSTTFGKVRMAELAWVRCNWKNRVHISDTGLRQLPIVLYCSDKQQNRDHNTLHCYEAMLLDFMSQACA